MIFGIPNNFKKAIGKLHFDEHFMSVDVFNFANFEILVFLTIHSFAGHRSHPTFFDLKLGKVELAIGHSLYNALVILPILA
jgi:hypothetical protein